MKRFLLILLTFVLVISNAPKSFAADDITGHYFESAIRTLIGKNIMGGYGDGIYKPNNAVTRAEFASLVVRALNIQSVQAAGVSIASVANTVDELTDVIPGKWYYPAVSTAVETGIVGGYPDKTFKPDKEITRQEMAAMIMRAINSKGVLSEPATLSFKDADQIIPIFTDAVQRIVYLGVMAGKGENTFAPLATTTRGEVAAVLLRVMNIIDAPEDLEFQVATLNANGAPTIIRQTDSYESAKNSLVDSQVILKGNKIVYMKPGKGLAAANKLVTIHPTEDLAGTGTTYVVAGTELNYLDATEKAVKVQIANTVGFANSDNVNLIPYAN